MERDGLLGLVAITIFCSASLFVSAAEKPKVKPKTPAPSAYADNIGKSCEDFQKKMEDYCTKEAPKRKKALDEEKKKLKPGEQWKQKDCDETKKTAAGATKICGNEERFVHKQTRYNIEYEFACNYEGKLSDRNRLAPHFRVDVRTGKKTPTQGKGYCVDDYRARALFKDKENCAQTGNGTGYGTPTRVADKNTCKGGTVQFDGNFSDTLVSRLDKEFKCFQAITKTGTAPDKKTVGDRVSGFYSTKEGGAEDGKVLVICRDDQAKFEQMLKAGMKEGLVAYDKDKGLIPSEATDDKTKEEAKKTLKDNNIEAPRGAVAAPDTQKEYDKSKADREKAETGVLAARAALEKAKTQQEKDKATERLKAAEDRLALAQEDNALYARKYSSELGRLEEEGSTKKLEFNSTDAEWDRERTERLMRVDSRPISALSADEREELLKSIRNEAISDLNLNERTKLHGKDNDVEHWRRQYIQDLARARPGSYQEYYAATYLCFYTDNCGVQEDFNYVQWARAQYRTQIPFVKTKTK